MTKKTVHETVTPTPDEDAARLRERLDGLEISQAEFAERYGIGSQAQYWQYLNPDKKGGRPLNITAAIGFAQGIDELHGPCKVGDFSPYLQGVIDRIAKHRTPINLAAQNVEYYDPLGELRPIINTISQLDDTRRAEVLKYAEERLMLQLSGDRQNSTRRAGQ